MKKVALKVSVCAVFVVLVSMFFAASVFAEDTSCKTKYPIILAHGMGFVATDEIPMSFPGIYQALKACGATVYFTTVPALQTNAVKSAEFKKQFLAIKATDGSAKFNIMGHSQGGLYTRYGISNLGLAPSVASLTTVNTPHRGSFMGSLLVSIQDIFPILKPLMSGFKLFPGDQRYADVNTRELTASYMSKTFNPNTPNKSGVYYQSWTGALRQYSLVNTMFGALNMMKKMLANNMAKTDKEVAYQLYDSMPMTATLCKYFGAGIGDGLVQESSAKWGTYLGVQKGPVYSVGVNHLDVVNLQFRGQVWDATSYWVSTVKDLKAKGY